jgi:mannose-1-phosphate guanylyltransferase
MMMNDLYAVIMAGGGGTRLWPLSRKSRPKQSLGFIDDRSLFRIAVDRITPLLPIEQILVVTVEEQAKQLQQLVPELPSSNYLLEPSPKGTASVVGLAASYLMTIDPESVMAVLTADHVIKNEEQFRSLLKGAHQIAKKGDLVTLGISPTYASTGYGYIQRGEYIGQVDEFRYYSSLGFKEKPPYELAEKYLSSGDYSWNSGMFIWRSERILEEIEHYMPDLAMGLKKIQAAQNAPNYLSVLEREWQQLQRQTVDYGIMERAERVVVFPADNLDWIDIGSWDRLYEVLIPDESGNIILSDPSILIDSSGVMVVKDQSETPDKLFALIGVDNLVVVDAGDVVLICHRDKAEEVRNIVKMISEQGMDRYL